MRGSCEILKEKESMLSPEAGSPAGCEPPTEKAAVDGRR